jgi:hypothetical protein
VSISQLLLMHSHTNVALPLPPPADPEDYAPVEYKSPVTNNTFTINLAPRTQAAAELLCQAQGAHLAVYVSDAEQADVEAYYVANGWLFPNYHVSWYIGLNLNSSSAWVWTDGMATGGWLQSCCTRAACCFG